MCLLVSLLAPGCPAAAGERVGAELSRSELEDRLAALELEEELILRRPNDVYLVIDLAHKVAHLKLNGRLLREASILSMLGSPSSPSLHVLDTAIPPETPESGSEPLRLRGRQFPLDFKTRLLEGARDRTRFYFTPSLLLSPIDLHTHHPGIQVSAYDIKALSSALEPGAEAIWIPAPTASVTRDTAGGVSSQGKNR